MACLVLKVMRLVAGDVETLALLGLISFFVDDYGNCKKWDVQYNKNNLSTIIATGNLKSFCEQEKHTFDMAKTLNVLRQ